MAVPRTKVPAEVAAPRAEPTSAIDSELNSIEQAILRAAQRQLDAPRPRHPFEPRLEEDVFSIWLMTKGRAQLEQARAASPEGNRERARRAGRRRQEIENLWEQERKTSKEREARGEDPEGKGVIYERICNKLNEKKEFKIDYSYMVSVDLPKLRKVGKLVPF